jgi:hypothetical protein
MEWNGTEQFQKTKVNLIYDKSMQYTMYDFGTDGYPFREKL